MFIGTIFEFLNIIHNLLVFVGQFYIIRIFLWYKEQSETVKTSNMQEIKDRIKV